MKKIFLAAFVAAIGVAQNFVQVTDTLLDPIGGANFNGSITLQPDQACAMTNAGVPFSLRPRRYCLGAGNVGCDETTAAGVVSIRLLATGVSSGTSPAGCFYRVHYQNQGSSGWDRVWTIPASGPVTIGQIETTVLPPAGASIPVSQLNGAALADGCLKTTGGVISSSTCSSGGGAWGTITGTLGNQTDLATVLAGKEPTIAGGLSTQFWNGAKAWVTLNTAAVPESGNLYFTNARAQAALLGLYEVPLTFSSPLIRTTNTITCQIASGSQAGCLSSTDWATFNGKQAAITGAPGTWPSFATVATSGAYADLSGKPTIPATQVNSDWNSVSGVSQILNKPSTFPPPNPSATTLGGIESIVPTTHQWLDSISTLGVPHGSQPAYSDLSGTNPGGVGSSSPTQILVNSAGTVGGVGTTGTGNVVLATGAAINLANATGLPNRVFTTYHAFGDSITLGLGASPNSSGYAFLIGADASYSLTNYGTSGWLSCDVANTEVFPNENPGNTVSPLYTIMIGTNDSGRGVGSYETGVYKPCLQAIVSWLAVPSTYKVFGQSGSATQTGTWATDNTYQTGIGIKSTTNGSTLSLPVTTYGSPIYVWYRVMDSNGGVFSYQLDGGSSVSVNSFTTPAIAAAGTQGVALIRIPSVAAGAHTVLITVTSSTSSSNTVSLLGVGTPSPYSYFQQPSVFVGGVPKQQSDANSAATAAYNVDAQSVSTLLAGDGLLVSFVNVRNFLNSSSDMFDSVHPNNTGHGHLRDAFESVIQPIPAPMLGGVVMQNPTITGSFASYMHTNTSNVASNTTLNPGVLMYSASSFDFGLDFAAVGGVYSTRLFTGASGNIVFSKVSSAGVPTSQSDFTHLVQINNNGSMQLIAGASGLGGGLALNSATSTTNLNGGVYLFGFSNNAYGMDLGYNGAYRTRIYTAAGHDIAFSVVSSAGVPTLQSDMTDLAVFKSTGTFQLGANCSSSGSPAVCGSAASGSAIIAAAATTVQVNTTAVTANSQILLSVDSSLGSKLGVTCNTTVPASLSVTARSAGASFTITSTAPITNPLCLSYSIIN